MYAERHADVYRRALNAVEELGWEVVSADFNSRRIEATDTTLWFRFKDDIVITFGTRSNDVVVNARSTSRVGVGASKLPRPPSRCSRREAPRGP